MIKMTEKLSCPACGQTKKRLRGEKNDFEIYNCADCGTLYATEKFENSVFDYDNYYDDNNLVIPDFVLEKIGETVRGFEKYRKTNRFLDVGCGAGTLIKAALKENWKAEGVEVSRSSVEFLRKENIEVFQGELSAANFPDDSFDVVAAIEILEHIYEPGKMLGEIHRVLRPGGLLWATTPHGRGASARMLGTRWSCVFPPEHLHLFSVKGIKNLLTKAGFRNPRILTEGVNPFEIINVLRADKNLPNDLEAEEGEESFSRVETGYQLNHALTKSPSRKMFKNLLNNLLNAARLGDSIKIWAEK